MRPAIYTLGPKIALKLQEIASWLHREPGVCFAFEKKKNHLLSLSRFYQEDNGAHLR